MNIKEFKLKFIQFKFKALKVLLGLLFITFFITLLDAIKCTVAFYMPFIVLFIAVSLFAEQVYLHDSPDTWGKSMSKN